MLLNTTQMGLNPGFARPYVICFERQILNLSGEAGFVLFLDLHALIFHDPWTNI